MFSASSKDLYEKIVQDITSENICRLYFLYGSEKQYVRKAAEKLISSIVSEEFSAFNLHRFDGKELDFEQLNFAKESLPVFDRFNLVYIKDCPVDSLKSDECDEFADFISDIPDTTVILISLPSTDCDFKGDSQKSLLNSLKNSGTVCCFSEMSESELKDLVIKHCRRNGKKISSYDASYLVRLSGKNSEKLLNEVEKICFFSENETISVKDIDEMTEKSVDALSYKISDFILKKKPDDAFNMLDECFKQHIEPVLIFGGMARTFTNFYLVSVYSHSGKSSSDLYNDFGVKENTFNAVKNYSAKYSLLQMRSFLDALGEADMDLKSTAHDQRIILEKLITRLSLTVYGEN